MPQTESMRRAALVTGGAKGIGRAVCLALAENGMNIAVNYAGSAAAAEETAAACRAFGVQAITLQADVRSPEACQNLVEDTAAAFGRIDVLVNNAGISFVGLLQDMSDAQWSEILNTNLSSVFYCCRSAISHMVSQKSGKIINISSMWGTVGASCEAAYSATKSGMNGLTKALAKELAPSNVQVNAIACGVIDTAMNAQFSEEEREALREEIPAGRFADSEEVAALALTLASGHSYLTGQIIGLDGGYI